MNLAELQPWQLLLWIVLLEIASAPIITLIMNTIFIGYFRAKEAHVNRLTNAFSKAFEKIAEEIGKKVGSKNGD